MRRVLISPQRPNELSSRTHLAKIIAKMDRVAVRYQLPIPADGHRLLAGWGRLHVESSERFLWCRVMGEMFRPSPFEFAFHSFWLTRRGMILAVAGVLADRPLETRAADEIFIQPTGIPDRDLRAQAARWLK